MDEELIREWTDELYALTNEPDKPEDIRYRFDMELFTRLRQTFVTATGLNGNIVDSQGDLITTIMNERAPKFCLMVQSVPEGKQRCLGSDRRLTAHSIAKGEAVVCRCHAGLYDCAAPIQFQRSGMGAFVTGQVLLQPPTETFVAEVVRRVSDLGLDPVELAKAVWEVPQISEEKLKAASEFMQLLADYIEKSLEEAESKRKEAEWRSLLREMEMKVVQAKLHPHFLFNILNLISGQALLENAVKTHATVNQLSKMLRYMVKSYKPLVTLEEELENLDSYVLLQGLRFEDRLTLHLEKPEQALRSVKLPGLTLQILIENAIKHGIEPKEGPCRIELRIRRNEDYLVIDIEDDGVGMDAGELLQVNSKDGDFSGILSGIGMIRKQFDYYYGDDFELRIDSREGQGTLVSVSLPLVING